MAGEVGAIFLESSATENQSVSLIVQLNRQKSSLPMLIVDTAGRLHIDDDMMEEIKELHAAINPTETLFVVMP